MKRFLGLISFFVMTLTFATAQSVEIGGLKYYLYADTHEAVLIDLNTWTGELDIPAEFKYNDETYTVTKITSMAFQDCAELTKVRFPKTLETITSQMFNLYGPSGWLAPSTLNPFVRCTSLESIEVDEENPSLCSVDGVLFSKDMSKLYSYPAGKRQENYTVPETVTWIGDGAFCYNYYLSSLVIPNNVTNINCALCVNCTNLKSVLLSENIIFIGAYTFQGCVSLQFLDIPGSVGEFAESVFSKSG